MRSLAEPLMRALDNMASNIHVALPARVESYDHTTQRASVKPLLRRAYRGAEPESMPVVDGVPVVWPRAGAASFTMPVNRGDTVLLVFTDRSIDRWLVQGDEVTPDDGRKHDISDAIAIPGLMSFATMDDPAPNNTDVFLRFGDTEFALRENGDIEATPASGLLLVNGTVQATEQVLDFCGTVDDLRQTYNTHTHTQGADSNGHSQQPTDPPSEEVACD